MKLSLAIVALVAALCFVAPAAAQGTSTYTFEFWNSTATCTGAASGRVSFTITNPSCLSIPVAPPAEISSQISCQNGRYSGPICIGGTLHRRC